MSLCVIFQMGSTLLLAPTITLLTSTVQLDGREWEFVKVLPHTSLTLTGTLLV